MRTLPEPFPDTARWLLIGGLAFYLADATNAAFEQRLSPPPQPLARVQLKPEAATAPAQSQPSVARLLATTEPEPSAATPVTGSADSPARQSEGTLNVTLVGTMAGVGGAGVALLTLGGENVVVSAGQPLEDWTLSAVFATSAVLNRGGRTETLEMNAPLVLPSATAKALPEPARQASSSSGDSRGAATPVESVEPITSLKELVALLDDAATLSKQGGLKPVTREDKVFGYAVRVKSPAFPLVRLGLQDGDIVTAVNGESMDGPEALTKIYRILRNTTDYRIEFERQGKPEALEVHLEP